jgi:two-component system phosphate regulon response regulator PhoB
MKSERILIVDDEAAIREMIAIALDIAGFDTIEAEDAIEGAP